MAIRYGAFGAYSADPVVGRDEVAEAANWYFNHATQARRDAFNARYNAIHWSPVLSPAEKRRRHAENDAQFMADIAPALALTDETERQIADTGEISDNLSEKWSEAKAKIDGRVMRAAHLMMEDA